MVVHGAWLHLKMRRSTTRISASRTASARRAGGATAARRNRKSGGSSGKAGADASPRSRSRQPARSIGRAALDDDAARERQAEVASADRLRSSDRRTAECHVSDSSFRLRGSGGVHEWHSSDAYPRAGGNRLSFPQSGVWACPRSAIRVKSGLTLTSYQSLTLTPHPPHARRGASSPLASALLATLASSSPAPRRREVAELPLTPTELINATGNLPTYHNRAMASERPLICSI